MFSSVIYPSIKSITFELFGFIKVLHKFFWQSFKFLVEVPAITLVWHNWHCSFIFWCQLQFKNLQFLFSYLIISFLYFVKKILSSWWVFHIFFIFLHVYLLIIFSTFSSAERMTIFAAISFVRCSNSYFICYSPTHE